MKIINYKNTNRRYTRRCNVCTSTVCQKWFGVRRNISPECKGRTRKLWTLKAADSICSNNNVGHLSEIQLTFFLRKRFQNLFGGYIYFYPVWCSWLCVIVPLSKIVRHMISTNDCDWWWWCYWSQSRCRLNSTYSRPPLQFTRSGQTKSVTLRRGDCIKGFVDSHVTYTISFY